MAEQNNPENTFPPDSGTRKNPEAEITVIPEKSSPGPSETEAGKDEPGSVSELSQKDLDRLQELDWVNASITRFRQGKHSDPTLEALLSRRLDLPRYGFLAPYPLRVLCTFGFCLAGCGLAWLAFWMVLTVFGLENLLRELSLMMSLLLVAMFGIGVTHPLEIYDETEIEKTGTEVLRQFRSEQPAEAQSPDTGSS
jgi:hypothetical protein